jgi:hypothetical protein
VQIATSTWRTRACLFLSPSLPPSSLPLPLFPSPRLPVSPSPALRLSPSLPQHIVTTPRGSRSTCKTSCGAWGASPCADSARAKPRVRTSPPPQTRFHLFCPSHPTLANKPTPPPPLTHLSMAHTGCVAACLVLACNSSLVFACNVSCNGSRASAPFAFEGPLARWGAERTRSCVLFAVSYAIRCHPVPKPTLHPKPCALQPNPKPQPLNMRCRMLQVAALLRHIDMCAQHAKLVQATQAEHLLHHERLLYPLPYSRLSISSTGHAQTIPQVSSYGPFLPVPVLLPPSTIPSIPLLY